MPELFSWHGGDLKATTDEKLMLATLPETNIAEWQNGGWKMYIFPIENGDVIPASYVIVYQSNMILKGGGDFPNVP